MKKIFALMFVCATMTAMAVTPQLNHVKVNPSRYGMHLQEAPMQVNLGNQQSAAADLSQSLPAFFESRNVTPNDNPLMKKAPRRISGDVLLNSNPLVFGLTFAYDANDDQMEVTNPVFYGGWNVNVEQGSAANEFYYYIHFTSLPNIIYVDLQNNIAEMQMGVMHSDHWTDSVQISPRAWQYFDTTEYILVYDEASLMANADPVNIQGTISDDGSIHFPDGFCYYVFQYITKTTKTASSTTVETDTVQGLLSEFIHDTWLMVPNGVHTYSYKVEDEQGNIITGQASNDVYMYQADDNTAYVWNMWGLGNRQIQMTLNADRTVEFPSQAVMYADMSASEAAYPQYDFSEAFMTFSGNVYTGNGIVSEDPCMGTVTANSIQWGATTVGNYYSRLGVNYYPGFIVGAFYNNALTFTGEDDFFLVGKTDNPSISYDVTDDAVIITVSAQQGANYVLTVNGQVVESPYSFPRGSQDQTITVECIAQVPGMNPSEMVTVQIVVPAKENTGLRGDVNMDNEVNITDVIILISSVLTENFESINVDNANVNYDDSVNITDVIQLINYVSSGHWYDD